MEGKRGPPSRAPALKWRSASLCRLFLVLQLEDLPLSLGELHLHLGGLLQVFLELAAQVFRRLHLFEVLVGDVQRAQHGAVHQGDLGFVQHLLDLGVHMGGHLFHVPGVLGSHQGIALPGD